VVLPPSAIETGGIAAAEAGEIEDKDRLQAIEKKAGSGGALDGLSREISPVRRGP
jgi:hypothetical protein